MMEIVESAGYEMSDCVKVTVYLSDISLFPEINKVYEHFFREPYPARSCIEASAIPKGAMLEVDAIFVRSA
jgi:2-iminobutanoate/2-iminopropanoate deaminase